jgi:hypothetical protein
VRLYYSIWVDLIIRAKSQPSNKSNWQIMTLFYMSITMAIDLLFVMILLQEFFFGYYFYKIDLMIISKELSEIFSFIILFFLPPLFVNYFLIFRNRRYLILINNYKYSNGLLATKFILLGLFVPVIMLIFANFFEII